MTSTEAKWSERVRSWRASGKTAAEFATDQEFEASTLRYWSSKLKSVGVPSAPPLLARVVRRQAPTGCAVSVASSELVVVVGEARIVVRRGFDATLLREITMALGGTR